MFLLGEQAQKDNKAAVEQPSPSPSPCGWGTPTIYTGDTWLRESVSRRPQQGSLDGSVRWLWEIAQQLFIKLNIHLSYGPATRFRVFSLEKWKFIVHTKTSTQMFIVALFRITKHWKQLRCPSAGKWLNKPWSMHVNEYSSIKWKVLVIHATTWRNLKNMMLSEKKKGVSKCYILHDFRYTTYFRKRQNDKGGSATSGRQMLGVEEGLTTKGGRRKFWRWWPWLIWKDDMNLYMS